jgi:hypothetical protein
VSKIKSYKLYWTTLKGVTCHSLEIINWHSFLKNYCFCLDSVCCFWWDTQSLWGRSEGDKNYPIDNRTWIIVSGPPDCSVGQVLGLKTTPKTSLVVFMTCQGFVKWREHTILQNQILENCQFCSAINYLRERNSSLFLNCLGFRVGIGCIESQKEVARQKKIS